jgi:hypothetical protein
MVALQRSPTDAVALPAPGAPADHGLASLGLMMQLAGSATAGLAALAAAVAWLGGWFDRHAGWLAVALALGVARSVLHRIAGRDLIYGRRTADGAPGDPFAAMRGYAGFGAVHAIAIGLIAAHAFDQPRATAAGITAALALWPAALAVVARAPRFARLRDGIPLGEDRGLEGAAIIMTVLGTYGLLSSAAILALVGGLSHHHLEHGWGAMLVVVFLLLVARSSLHVRAGLAGLRDSSFDRPSELAARYAAFGVISAFCVGGMLALFAMSERLTPDAMLGIAVTCWLLAAWPMIVRRYFQQRQFAELLAGDRVTHRRAPDAGLTALGWLLAGHAALLAALVILQRTAALPFGRIPDSALVLGGAAVGRWWAVQPSIGVALVALELAAAVALIRMSDKRRVITATYAVFAGVVALGPAIPVIRSLGHHPALGTAIHLLPPVVQLVLPITALVLVRRDIAPAARASYRRRRPA